MVNKLPIPMKNIIQSSLLLLLLSSSIVAQPYSRATGTEVIYDPGSNFVQIYKSDEVSGTPFFMDKFVNGRVILMDDKVTETMEMDFDGFKQEIIIKKDDAYKVLKLSNTKGFVFLDKDDEVSDYFTTGFNNPDLDILPDNYVKVIYDGDVKLIADFKVVYKEENFSTAVNGVASNKYESEITYYIIRENGEYKKTRMRTRNIIRDLGAFEKELKAYVKENKLNGRSDADAALILIEYEKLKENS